MRRLSKSNAVLGQDTEHTVTTLKTVQMFQMDEAVHAAMLRAEWQAELLPVESLFFSLTSSRKVNEMRRALVVVGTLFLQLQTSDSL